MFVSLFCVFKEGGFENVCTVCVLQTEGVSVCVVFESVYVCVQVMRSVYVLCVQVMESVYVLCVSQCISQHSATPDCGVLSVII